ncbi:hypothetical protein PG993_011752 [Apiospora rasikravindrae]|uniref:Secreted protein n=1 Tax=Apiospora rasikravindrae TaxID=990691 RepID=A0ABR1S0I0_9PEZI
MLAWAGWCAFFTGYIPSMEIMGDATQSTASEPMILSELVMPSQLPIRSRHIADGTKSISDPSLSETSLILADLSEKSIFSPARFLPTNFFHTFRLWHVEDCFAALMLVKQRPAIKTIATGASSR